MNEVIRIVMDEERKLTKEEFRKELWKAQNQLSALKLIVGCNKVEGLDDKESTELFKILTDAWDKSLNAEIILGYPKDEEISLVIEVDKTRLT